MMSQADKMAAAYQELVSPTGSAFGRVTAQDLPRTGPTRFLPLTTTMA
jgi:hypothetical protein